MKTQRRFITVFLLVLFVVLFISIINVYKGYNDYVHSGNPVIEGRYADPEIALFNNTFWIFPTYSASFSEQDFLDAFSSNDLVNWEKHSRIIDTSIITWADSAIWAPCIVQKNDFYYLFFGANDIQTPESRWFDPKKHPADMTGGIGIAVASDPGGPYRDYIGKPLIGEVLNGAQPIDQFVYEENGQYFIFYGGWGVCNFGRLNDDFTALIPFENGDVVKNITPEGYVEGPVIFKREGIYYMMWSEGDWTDESYKVAYGKAGSIDGPYVKEGVVLQADSEIATGAGHHSVLNIPGTSDWYIVYHRRPIPNEDRDHRVVCIDRLYFDEEGNILPVKMTFEGVAQRKMR